MESCIYLNGKKNGEFESYYENGQLSSSQSYIDDMMNGDCKQYYANGQLCEQWY